MTRATNNSGGKESPRPGQDDEKGRRHEKGRVPIIMRVWGEGGSKDSEIAAVN